MTANNLSGVGGDAHQGGLAVTDLSHQPNAANPADNPLVLTHGFTQNAACWGRFGRALSQLVGPRSVLAVDAPGHGKSGHDDVDLWRAGELLAQSVPPAVHVGYSMGGRIALHAALEFPEAVTGLVLIGTTAGIDDSSEREERRRSDEALADRLDQTGLSTFLDSWLANPLFAGLDDEDAARSERLTNRADGLAATLRHRGTGTQEPLWHRLGDLQMPVLLVVGSEDRKFHRLAERVHTEVDDSRVLTLPGTHPIHLEQPKACAQAVAKTVTDWAEIQHQL